MTPIAFLADAPDSIILAKGAARSRVQIAKTGKFKDPRYGNFAITTVHFDTWEQNFQSLHRADGRLGLPVDVDHSPEKKGETEAAGWVVELDRMGHDGKTPTPNELWATVEWNSLGQELVSDRRYVYLSPSYQHNFTDEEGKQHGTALVGVALTNRPFLSMATVSLSKTTLATEDDEAYSPRQMSGLLDNLRTTFKLSADADEATVLAAASAAVEKANAPVPTNSTPGDINLAEVASAQGMVVLSAADHLKLASDAAKGAAAAAELHTTKFDTAFNAAVSLGKVLPAMKDTFLLAYNANADETIKSLSELPANATVNTTAQGVTGDSEGVEASATTLADASTEGWTVDSQSAKIDARVEKLLSEGVDFDVALEQAMAEVR